MEHCAHVLVLLFILVSYSTIAVAQIQWAPYSPDAQSTFYEPPASSGIKRGILNPFVITWLNAAPQPMQDALFYAANTILASLLDFQVTIRVQANYTSLQANYLGFAGPSAFCPVTLGGTTAYSIPAIRDNQAGSHVCNTQITRDIDAFFSDLSNTPNVQWDFGTNTAVNPVNTAVDFVSVAMHELLHGLGFLSNFMKFSNGTIRVNRNPCIYDLFVVRGQDATNRIYLKPDGAADLTSDDVYFYLNDSLSPSFVQLYAPATYGASSIGHYVGDAQNLLMMNALMLGTRQRSVGPYALRILQMIGHSLTSTALAMLGITVTTPSATTTTPAPTTTTPAPTTTTPAPTTTTPAPTTTTPAPTTTTPVPTTTTPTPTTTAPPPTTTTPAPTTTTSAPTVSTTSSPTTSSSLTTSSSVGTTTQTTVVTTPSTTTDAPTSSETSTSPGTPVSTSTNTPSQIPPSNSATLTSTALATPSGSSTPLSTQNATTTSDPNGASKKKHSFPIVIVAACAAGGVLLLVALAVGGYFFYVKVIHPRRKAAGNYELLLM